MKHLITLVLCILTSVFAASAQQRLYVAPDGDDTAAGTASAPLAGIQAAVSRAGLLPGDDTVYIHVAPGTYFLDAPISIGPSDTRPMVIEGNVENMPVISGGYRVGGWKLTPEGWWKTTVPEVVKYGKKFSQLYVNGRRAVLARTPDKGLFKVIGQVEQIPVETDSRDSGYGYYVQRYSTAPENLSGLEGINSGEWISANMKDRQMRIMLYQAWDNTYKYVDYINPGTGSVYLHGPKLHSMYSRHNLFRLENYKEAMTAPGEWFLENDGTLFYIPLEGENPATAEVFAPALERLLTVKGEKDSPVRGKVFRNISFRHTAYTLPMAGTTPYQAASHLDGTVNVEDAEGIVFQNCEITHTGNYAAAFDRVRGCSLEHSFLFDLGGGGVKLDNSSNVRIVNNIIRKGGQVFPAGVGVLIRESSRTKVLHNDIGDLRYSGVSCGWVWGYSESKSFENEIAYNHIHHLGWGELDDMGGVYTLGIQPGTTVHHNLIHDIYSHNYGGWGLYTDEGSTGIVMENNLVYACKTSGFHQHYGKDNVIRNNIFAWSTWSQLQWSRVEDHRSFSFERNIILTDGFPLLSRQSSWKEGRADFNSNCFWDTTRSDPYFDDMTPAKFREIRGGKTLIADPMFRDPLHGDFSFKSLKTVRKMGFKPFDVSGAGVTGGGEWKARAEMTPEEKADFREIVRRQETEYFNSGMADYRPEVAARPGIDRPYPRYYDD